MKKCTAFCLTLLMILSLCACGGQPQETAEDPEAPAATETNDPSLGRYLCTAVTMDGMDLGADGQWLTLKEGGEAILYLGGEADEAKWTLSGTAFTLTMGSETVATGTLAEGTLTADLMGMSCTFIKEGAQIPSETPTEETPPAEFTPSMGTFTCQGLYTVTYPLDTFQAPGDGLTDLVSASGTKIWFTKLDTKVDANRWQSDFEAKLAGESILQFEQLTLTAGEYPAEAVIYEEADGWHAAVLVDFGRNRGAEGKPMTAASLYLSGPTREDVWNDNVQSMVSSLKLGQ